MLRLREQLVRWQWRWLFLLALIIFAYGNSFSGAFQFDDWNVIVFDSRVQSLSAWWHAMPAMRPLFKLSFAAQFQFGASLVALHVFNFILHLSNVALLALLLNIILPWYLPSARVEKVQWICCAVFALHPVQTEAITYLSGRSVALELCAILLAANAAARFFVTGLMRYFWLCVSAFTLAMLARETALIVPLLLGGIWYLSPSMNVAEWARARKLLTTCALMAIGAFILIVSMPAYLAQLGPGWGGLSWLDVIARQSQSQGYLWQIWIGAIPLNADPKWEFAPFSELSACVALLFIVLWIALIVGLRKNAVLWAFALFWVGIAWIPAHSFFVRADAVNDRQWYVAGVGAALLSALLMEMVLRQRAALVAGVICVALAVLTMQRNEVYRSEVAYWQDVIDKSPGNARAWNNIGYALACAGQLPAAEFALMQAVKLPGAPLSAAANLALLRSGALRCRST